jgi:hypothetical protein
MSRNNPSSLTHSGAIAAQASFVRVGLQLRLSGPRSKASVDLRGFAASTALGWLSFMGAVAFFYRSGTSDLHFVFGLGGLIAGCSLVAWAHRRLAQRVERECVTVGMSEAGAHRYAREMVFHLWTGRAKRHPVDGQLQRLLKDFPA